MLCFATCTIAVLRSTGTLFLLCPSPEAGSKKRSANIAIIAPARSAPARFAGARPPPQGQAEPRKKPLRPIEDLLIVACRI